MSTNFWNEPDRIVIALRCTSIKYAKAMIESGQLKFSTPKSWEKNTIQGRGDIYEGTLAFVSKDYPEQFNEISHYEDTYTVEMPRRILIKNKKDMELPCFCLYALNLGSFSTPDSEGKCRLKANIDKRYFQNIADNMSKTEIEAQPYEDRPAIVVIKDLDAFLEKLKIKLISLGVSEDQILIRTINYNTSFDKYASDDNWMDLNVKLPMELFEKRREFEYQKELRVVVNTGDAAIKSLLKSPIEIGNLSDIAVMCEGYQEEGILVEATFDCYQVK